MASAVGKDQVARDSGGMAPNAVVRLEHDAATCQMASHDSQRSDDDRTVSPRVSTSSINSPPYWMTTGNHQRNRSADSIPPVGAITLQDNDTSEHDDRNKACWAKSVEIIDHTVVNGGATSIGAFVVWNVRVETLSVRHRPSLFDHCAGEICSWKSYHDREPI